MTDFSGSNLRGRNFTGQDLRGKDFSNADIRGTNFSGADLSGADFTGAKAGLQRRWFFSQLGISLIVSVTLNFIAATINAAAVAYLFSSEVSRNAGFIPGGCVVLLLIAVFLAISHQGLTTRAVATSIVAFAFAFAGAVASGGTIAGAVASAFAGVFAGAVASAFASAIVVASASAFAFAVAVGVFAGAFFGAFGVGVAFAFAVGVGVAIMTGLLSIYIAWRVSRNDEKFALVRQVGIVFSSIGGTRFYKADLTGANFMNATLKSTSFREANLTHVCWKNTQKLDRARVGDSILRNSAVRELLTTRKSHQKSYVAADLEGANLQGVDLEAANLTRANISNAILYDANLKDANLREILAVGTDFTRAYLTGACLEAWNIDHTTKLDQIDCQYVFLLEKPNTIGSRERRPHDPDAVFAPGDFEKLYNRIINTVQILMRNGINPEAFADAFQKLMQDNLGVTRDSIQALEKKGKDVLVTIEVPEDADKAKIAQTLDINYRNRLHQLEAENKQLQLRSTDLRDIAIELAKRQPHIHNHQTMNDKAEHNTINIGGNVTGSTINLGEISGAVSNVVNQLSSAADPAQPGLKEHLLELQATIEEEPTLSIEDKADALEEVKVLAEAAQDPEKQGLGRKAIKVLKGTVASLPDAAKLAEACKTLLPLIAKAIGIPLP